MKRVMRITDRGKVKDIGQCGLGTTAEEASLDVKVPSSRR